MMTFGSLFAGIGGFDLALEKIGMTCKWQVEIDPFCQKVLAKHFPNVQRYSDVKEVGSHNLEPVDLICGGFPCQPFSVAGKQRGKEDDRYLWDEMLRVISELKPSWVIGENVAGIIELALEQVCASLEVQGYEVQPLIIPACAVNAPHRRDRVWIIANRTSQRYEQPEKIRELGRERSPIENKRTQGSDCNVADTDTKRFQTDTREYISTKKNKPFLSNVGDTKGTGFEGSDDRQGETEYGGTSAGSDQWDQPWIEVATRLCRASHGFSAWLDYNWRRITDGTQKRITRQDLSCLWQDLQQESVQRDIRRCYPLLKEENLLAVVRKLETGTDTSDSILFEGTTIQGNAMRAVWGNGGVRRSPQGRSNQEQPPREYPDTLSPLSHEIALATESFVWRYECETNSSDRVHRLKALGNAVVPQIVEQIGRAIITQEELL
jgi:DNA-cytosine methyltransferase